MGPIHMGNQYLYSSYQDGDNNSRWAYKMI